MYEQSSIEIIINHLDEYYPDGGSNRVTSMILSIFRQDFRTVIVRKVSPKQIDHFTQ